MKAIAKKYMDAGLSVLPVKKDKSPDVSKWKDVDIEIDKFDNAKGIGVKCGQVSGGLECLDFDNHFGDAKETISKFIAEIGDLYRNYKFPIESTVSGGFHLVFRCEYNDGNLKLAQKPLWDDKNNRWRPDAIIETRGKDGYFVSAPTDGYKWVRSSYDAIPLITKQERQELIDTAKSFNTWHELIKEQNEDKDRPGDLYNKALESADDMRNCLLSAGWTNPRGHLWRRPEKKEGISATLGKVAENIFYNFSANAYPFEPQKAYTAFQVVCLLKYNGDFKGFAKVLSEKYNTLKPNTKTYGEQGATPRDNHQLNDLLAKTFIDLDIAIERPPICMEIRTKHAIGISDSRLFTLGNFSAITGKAKSKKSMLTSLLLASAATNGTVQGKLISKFPNNKQGVLLFDTEQSDYDTYISGQRVLKIINNKAKNYGVFALREYTPFERIQVIEYALESWKGNIGYVVIDGIVDLAISNDEAEAIKVIGLLMKWTKIYNCHITTVIHQNKGDNYATGHIGSAVIKKAETIISVSKDPDNKMRSLVSNSDIRGVSEFDDFIIEIGMDGVPFVSESGSTPF